MGVIAGGAMRGHFLGLAMLELSRDLLIAATYFQSEYLERPNAQVNRRQCEALTSELNRQLGDTFSRCSLFCFRNLMPIGAVYFNPLFKFTASRVSSGIDAEYFADG